MLTLNKWRGYKFNTWAGSNKLQEKPEVAPHNVGACMGESEVDWTGKRLMVWTKMKASFSFCWKVEKDDIGSINIFQAHISFCWTWHSENTLYWLFTSLKSKFLLRVSYKASYRRLGRGSWFFSQVCWCWWWIWEAVWEKHTWTDLFFSNIYFFLVYQYWYNW